MLSQSFWKKYSPVCTGILFSLILLLTAGFTQTRESVYSPEHQLDINNADWEEISRLPIPTDLAEKIYYRLLYQGPFTSIYQLRQVEGMTQELFLKIKPLVRIEPFIPRGEREERIEQLYYQIERWEGNEGTSQALIDTWIEQALEPVQINSIRYDQLLNLQGVSPVDAAAIVNYRSLVGQISSLRDLRSAPYLSYFGYRNARDFISFEPETPKKEFHGHLLYRVHNTPFQTEEAEATAILPAETIENNYPDVYTRLMASYGPDIKLGVSWWHALYEPVLYEDFGAGRVPRPKFYVGIENQKLGPLEVRKVYLGNYALAFGEGVVMENTDFFLPRKTGFGFRKRFLGLSGDNSRTRQYKLSGVATELAYKNARLFLFGSFDKRDAILNTTPETLDGKAHYAVNQLIVLDQRFEFAPGDNLRQNLGLSWRDAVQELLYGFHAEYSLLPATQLGLTYYESAYDKLLRPDIQQVVDPANINQIILADNEVFNTYGGPLSDSENPFWGGAKSFRRVYGLNVQSVYENMSVQAEYAELDKYSSPLGKNPRAFVGSAYVQYNSFYLMGLYRDYSLEFDNPYQRSFSNYRRYKRTIFERYFYLQNPLYGQLYSNNPQPQAERGFYLNSRYQFSRKFTLNMEYDNWLRKADDASQFRLVGTLNFRPIFPITVSLRQKYQAREKQNRLTTEYFENLEFRGTLRARLSRFSELGLFYSSSVTKFRPRPRLYFPVQPGDSLSNTNLAGNIASPGEALGGYFTHNFNRWLKVKGFMGYYQGFLWNFEDTQFMVMDSFRGAMRFWFSVYSRISSQINIRLKYTRDYQFPITDFHARTTGNVPIESNSGRYYQGTLIQPVQDFFYVELNYHF